MKSRKVLSAIPWGFLGMLALIVPLEGVIARNWLDFSDPVSLSWRLSADAVEREAPRCDVLCVGDSLIKHAMIPRVLTERSGLRAVNLAVARGPAPATYFFLRRALDAGARPAAIVVDFKPVVLVGSPRYNLRYWREIANARECLELGSTDGRRLMAEIALGRVLPSVRSRLEVRSWLLAALRGEKDQLYEINRTCARNWQVNDGANIATKNPAYHGGLRPQDDTELLTHVYYCHKSNLTYIHRFFQLAHARGLPVYWVLPPTPPAFQARREEAGAEAGYLELVRTVQSRYPNVTVLDARHSGYEDSVFVDLAHLDGEGAYALSTAVGDVLRRDRTADRGASGSRWIDLPACRTPPVGLPFEDVEQSRKIVRALDGSTDFIAEPPAIRR